MNSSNSIWCWRRWIKPEQQEAWIERLQGVGVLRWTLTQQSGHARVLLAVYAERKAEVARLLCPFGGRVCAVKETAWNQAKPAPPLRIGKRFEIVHEKTPRRKSGTLPQLHIPQGMAFGSGEHATTLMLLHALARHRNWPETSVLDLGTGSGVLALAARLLGAKKMVATDYDPDAVRIAQENEALNFPAPLIRWQRADVKRLRARTRYDLILANLFSGILVEAAPQIVGALAPGGQLWLSGILRTQQTEIEQAYRRKGLDLARAARRGKWVLLQWRKK